MEDLDYFLDKYDALPLDTDKYKNSYIGWALEFFLDETEILNPCLDITLRLDLTDAEKNYQDNFQNQYSTFTSFLIWKLLQALKKHTPFWWRFIKEKEKWYQINNPPLYFIIAVGGDARFGEFIINNATKLGWLEFSQLYKNGKDSVLVNPVLASDRKYAYRFGQYIANLPSLDFLGFTMHTSRNSTQSFFYFGKRTYDEIKKRLTLPFAIKFHHSNLDLFMIELLVKDYQVELSKADLF